MWFSIRNKSARQSYEVKAIYIATEDPTLNLGRVLIRVNNGGRFAPISRIPSDYANGLRQLPKIG